MKLFLFYFSPTLLLMGLNLLIEVVTHPKAGFTRPAGIAVRYSILVAVALVNFKTWRSRNSTNRASCRRTSK